MSSTTLRTHFQRRSWRVCPSCRYNQSKRERRPLASSGAHFALRTGHGAGACEVDPWNRFGRNRSPSVGVSRTTCSFIPMLREEVSRLPERYRQPVVLCYLDGKTNEEAGGGSRGARIGTIKGRLSRARQRLRDRLCSPRAAPLPGAAGWRLLSRDDISGDSWKVVPAWRQLPCQCRPEQDLLSASPLEMFLCTGVSCCMN